VIPPALQFRHPFNEQSKRRCHVSDLYHVIIDYLDDPLPSFGHQIVEADSAEEACELAVIEPITVEHAGHLTVRGTGVRVMVLASQVGNKGDWAEVERLAPFAHGLGDHQDQEQIPRRHP
jgi:hypothetical protein